MDDIWLSAWALDVVRKSLGSDDILTDNWDGEAPLLALISDILDEEESLTGGEKKKILAYTGCDRVLAELGASAED